MNKYVQLLIGLALFAIAILTSIFCPEWGLAALNLIKGLIIVAIAIAGIFIIVIVISNIKKEEKIRY